MITRALLGLTLLALSGFSQARVVDQPLFVRPPQTQTPEVTAPVPVPVAPAVPLPATARPAGSVRPLPVTLPATTRPAAPPTPASGVRPAASGAGVGPARVQGGTVKPRVSGLGLKAASGNRAFSVLGASGTVLNPSLGFRPLSVVFKLEK